MAVRIAPDGTVMDAAQIVLATATQTQTPAIAVAGTTGFIVYIDTSYQALPVRLVSLSASGVVGLANAAPLDISAAPQRLLAMARGDGQTLVIWADDEQGIYASALLAARISDAGAVLDATPIVLSAAAPNKQGAIAAAAWAATGEVGRLRLHRAHPLPTWTLDHSRSMALVAPRRANGKLGLFRKDGGPRALGDPAG